MYTVKELKDMDLGFKIGVEYSVFPSGARNANIPVIRNALFVGESGVDNDYLMFKSKEHGFVECFLKKDILYAEYKVYEVNAFGKKKVN